MDEHFRPVQLCIPVEDFHRLPQTPAYKYEYFGGRAVQSPRPKAFHCALDLPATFPDPTRPVAVRPVPPGELAGLADVFAAAVRRTQPFESLESDAAKAAAAAVYAKAVSGGDGPVIEAACVAADGRRGGRPAGGVLVTLADPSILSEPFGGAWRTPPPADAVARRLGVPHLTWAFVDPYTARRGVGTAMPTAAAAVLAEMGFRHLASTFALDNGPSALWHWRNGFRLLPQMSAMWKEAL